MRGLYRVSIPNSIKMWFIGDYIGLRNKGLGGLQRGLLQGLFRGIWEQEMMINSFTPGKAYKRVAEVREFLGVLEEFCFLVDAAD